MLTAFLNWVARQSPAFTELSERNKYLEERTRLAFEDCDTYRAKAKGIDAKNEALVYELCLIGDRHKEEMAAALKERDDRIAWLQAIVDGFESERKHLLHTLAMSKKELAAARSIQSHRDQLKRMLDEAYKTIELMSGDAKRAREDAEKNANCVCEYRERVGDKIKTFMRNDVFSPRKETKL